MRSIVRWLLASVLVAIFTATCASGKKANAPKEETYKAPKKTSSSIPTEIPDNLLPNLVVGVDSCYVFLKPDEDSQFFGPLVKKENVKRVDSRSYWIHVWIPRLRISGWVRKHKLYAAKEESSEQGSIPTELLNTLSITKKVVNIRKSATVRAPIIHKAKERQEFLVLDEKKGWYLVWIPQLQKRGWVSGAVAVKQRKR